ncbi:MAG: hypothetical protein K6G42_05095, partial [Lachnospiraceae bacterium]|nr:hypothetical protein [Lachnospiraceae bacterium]
PQAEYNNQFKRYDTDENVTLSYDDADGRTGPGGYNGPPDQGGESDEYYDEEPEDQGFFARLFGRRPRK